jgi:hypothetical protein
VFLADYFVNEAFRRELLRVLNRGESVNSLKRSIYVGRVAGYQAKQLRASRRVLLESKGCKSSGSMRQESRLKGRQRTVSPRSSAIRTHADTLPS